MAAKDQRSSLDFPGLMGDYTPFCGTKERPIGPSRAVVPVMVSTAVLIEIELAALRSPIAGSPSHWSGR